jgi:tRNA dimethylallyltransferase
MGARREHDDQVGRRSGQPPARRGRGLDGADPGVWLGRHAGADAHVHATHDTPRVTAPPSVIALFGPTGVGKTAVALALAQRLRAAGEEPVAVSADALQVYRGLEVLTGAPTPARRPIVVGGTGLYLRAALADLDLRPPPPPGARERWEAELAQQGAPALHALLAERAPWAAEKIDRNDRQRIVRALELLDAGELEPPEGDNQLWTSDTRHPTLLAGLTMEREELYRRLDARVDAMLAAGARDEVLRAHAAGASETARKALGFDELLTGDVEAMKRRTRNLARRQLTWMRKLEKRRLVHVIDVTGRAEDDVAAEVQRLASRLPRP